MDQGRSLLGLGAGEGRLQQPQQTAASGRRYGGGPRYEIINKLDQLNREVDEIAAVITNGQVKVVVIPDDKKSEGVRHEAATKP